MTLRSKFATLATAAATAATVTMAVGPAQAEDGRNGAFVGGMLLGSMLSNGGGGYNYVPAPRYEPRYQAPRVIVRREYYYAPEEYYPRDHYRHYRHHEHRRWHHDNGYHRGWDDWD